MPTTCTTPVCDTYGGEGAHVVAVQPSQGPVDTSPSGSLPFTGLDVLLIAGVALALVVVGLIVRWLPERS